MDQAQFEAALHAAGFDPAVTVTREAGGHLGIHAHPFEARALIIDGEITLVTAEGARCYRAGDIFHLPAGLPHTETCGPAGVVYRVGRRPQA